MNYLTRLRHKLAVAAYPYRRTHKEYLTKFDGKELDPRLLSRQLETNQPEYTPQSIELRSFGAALRNPFLSKALAKDRLGEWALDAKSIEFFEVEIKRIRPRALLEFGAGISTICFCHFLQQIHGSDGGVCLYSVEQNDWQVDETQRRIDELGMSKYVHIIHAPQRRQEVEGQSGNFYDLTSPDIDAQLKDANIEMIVVDGPAGGDNVRFGALPQIRKFIKGPTPFYLDDALRTEELDVFLSWGELSYIQSLHVKAIGKGIGCGVISGPA